MGVNLFQIEGSGPLQVSLGEGHGKEHRFVFINPVKLLVIILFLIIVIITIITARYQISKGDDDNHP